MSKEQKMSDYDRGYLHGFDDAMEKPYEQREQEQISLPAPFRAQGQQIASDGDDKAFCDLYSKEQMLAYGKASELAIDKTRVKRIATQLGWMPPLDVEQEPVAYDVQKALYRAYVLGQKYWADADSESYSRNKRADKHRQDFETLCEEALFCTAPPQSKWQGLTDEEIWNADEIMAANSECGASFETLRELVHAISDKLKEKNAL